VSSRPFEPGLFLRIYILAQLVGDLLDREFRRAGVPAADFALASTLRIMQPATPTALAAQLGMAPTTLSAALRRLERRGHLRRLPNPDDRRSVLVELTPAGENVVLAAFPPFRAARERLVGELDQTWEAAGQQLTPLEDALRRALEKAPVS
jgi:DNA-binding MarR family transcriptional regulator